MPQVLSHGFNRPTSPHHSRLRLSGWGALASGQTENRAHSSRQPSDPPSRKGAASSAEVSRLNEVFHELIKVVKC